MFHQHQIARQPRRARLWAAGIAIAALATTVMFAGCDLSGLTGTACTPQTCDYFVNSLVAVGGQGSVTLLADSGNALYQYTGSQWSQVSTETAQQHGTLFASPAFATDHTLFLGNTTSTDGGKTWHQICAAVIAISPNFASDHTVFGVNAPVNSSGSPPGAPATGTPPSGGVTGCPTSSGLYYVSTDGGQTWQAAKAPANATSQPNVFVLSASFATDKTVFATFASTQNQQPAPALYVSTDGGQTWNSVLTGLQDIVAVSPNFDQDHTVIAVDATDVQLSTDGGQTWNKLADPLPSASDVAEIAFSPNFASDKTIMLVSAAVDQGSTAAHGTFVSTDNGHTWTNTGPVTQRETDEPAILFSPNYATDKTIYASSLDQGKGPASSTDIGKTWTAMSNGLVLQQPLGG